MRHAKSDWGESGLEDFERPLSSRGLEDAPRMGRALVAAEVVPDRIVASPARRAKETAERVAKGCGFAGSIQWEAALYDASGAAWLEAARGIAAKAEVALLVAHSPGIAEAAAAILGARARLRFPTGSVACLDLDLEKWADLHDGAGELRWLLVPRLVKALGV
jgi:phosphohistidine phosphatase